MGRFSGHHDDRLRFYFHPVRKQAGFCPHLWGALEASKEGRNRRDAGSVLELCRILIITEYIGKVLMVWIRVVVVQVQVGELAVFLKGCERT